MRILAALVAGCLSAATLGAADINGSVVIERRLTRRNVTAPAPAYQRGVAVPLESKPAEDPLALERSHVVVYIDGRRRLPRTRPRRSSNLTANSRRTWWSFRWDRRFLFPTSTPSFTTSFPCRSRDLSIGELPPGRDQDGHVSGPRDRLRVLPSASEHVGGDRG